MSKKEEISEALTKKYGNSRILQSPYFESIMDRYRLVGSAMSDRRFWEQEIKQMDPTISLRVWQSFMAKFHKQVKVKQGAIMERLEDETADVFKMQEGAMRKLSAIADVSLDQVIQNPNLLESIPIEKRVRWLLQAMRAVDSRAKTAMLKREDDRRQGMYDNMMDEARYGNDTMSGNEVSLQEAISDPGDSDPIDSIDDDDVEIEDDMDEYRDEYIVTEPEEPEPEEERVVRFDAANDL